MGAILRAIVRRPSPDSLICGTQSPEVILGALLSSMTAVLSGARTPAAKSAAVGVLLLLATASPHLHDNVLVDYFFLNEAAVLGCLLEVLKEAALHRTVGSDVVALLVLLSNCQRYDSRNPYHAHIRLLASESVLGTKLYSEPYVLSARGQGVVCRPERWRWQSVPAPVGSMGLHGQR